MIHINKIQEGGIESIVITGEVDASSSIELDNALAASLNSGYKKLLINCSALEYISSAGLGVFMSYIEDFKSANISFVLFGMNDKVSNTFGILGLDQLLSIAKTKEEALQMLS